MLKAISGFVVGVLLVAVVGWNVAGGMMFNIVESPYGVEETAARIQANILAEGKGWTISGLREPHKAVAAAGNNVMPVMLVETCSTDYSGPILQDDPTRILSILMPCTITVYKNNDGKVYIGIMNAALLGSLFGSKVGAIMKQVAADQAKFITFDPNKPAPPLIRKIPDSGGEGGGQDTGGC